MVLQHQEQVLLPLCIFSDVHVYPSTPSRYNSAQNLINTIESKYRNLKFIVTGGGYDCLW